VIPQSIGLGTFVFLVIGAPVASMHNADKPAQTAAQKKLRSGPATALAISPDGTLLVSSEGRSKDLTIWSLKERKVQRLLKGPGSACDLGFSADGKKLVASYGIEGLGVWDLKREPTLTLSKMPHVCQSACYSPDGKFLATVVGPLLSLWSAQTGKIAAPLDDLVRSPSCLAFSSDGAVLAVGSLGGRVALIDVKEMVKIREMIVSNEAGVGVAGVAFGPNDKTLASGSDDGRFTIWHTATGRKIAETRGDKEPVSAVIFSRKTGVMFAATIGGQVRCWHAHASAGFGFMPIGTPVFCAALDPRGSTLVLATGNPHLEADDPANSGRIIFQAMPLIQWRKGK
jgi:WD40 repeat protein